MPAEHPACLSCQSLESLVPASRIYIAAITQASYRSEADRELLALVGDKAVELCSPPRSAEPAPPFHPDLAAALGLVILVVLLGNAYSASRTLWWGPVGMWAGIGLVYLLLRGRWLAGYAAALARRKREREKQAGEMACWRKRYYCLRTRMLIDPGATGDCRMMAGELEAR